MQILDKRTHNILFVSHSAGLGGAERVTLELLEGLDRGRFRPCLAVPEAGLLEQRAVTMGIPVVRVSAPWWLPVGARRVHGRAYLEDVAPAVRHVETLIKDLEIDLVYSCSGVILHGALAALVQRTTHIHHVHELLGQPGSELGLPGGRADYAYRIVGALASLVVLPSRTAAADVGAAIAPGRQRVVYCGIRQASAISPTFPESRPVDEIHVGLVGAVTPRKGSEIIVAIVQYVATRNKQVHFFWAGPGRAEKLAALSEASRVDGAPHLHFLGYQDDVPAFLSRMHFLLHPAQNESFGRVVLEAGLLQRPAVVTPCGGSSETVQDSVTGFVVPASPDAVGDAILRLANDVGLRQRLGENARSFAETFDLGTFHARISGVLTEATSIGPVLSSGAIAALGRAALGVPSMGRKMLQRTKVDHAVRWVRTLTERGRVPLDPARRDRRT